jgi:PAS domain S-box-containing protein
MGEIKHLRKNEPDQIRALETALDRSTEIFQFLVNAVQDYAIFALDPNGNVATWNVGAQRLKGYTSEEIIGAHFSRFYAPEDVVRDHPALTLKVAIQNGKFEEENWRVRKDGTRFWASVVVTPIRNFRGELIGFAKVTRDLTERKHIEEALRKSRDELELAKANEKQKFLSHASVVLSSSLDYQQTLQRLADLANSFLSDWCSVDVIVSGAPRSVALSHPVSWKKELIAELQKRFPPDWASSSGRAEVLRKGKALLYSDIPDELLVRTAQSPEHLEILRKLGMKSAMLVPIISRGRVLGVIGFVSSESGRRYTEQDLEGRRPGSGGNLKESLPGWVDA